MPSPDSGMCTTTYVYILTDNIKIPIIDDRKRSDWFTRCFLVRQLGMEAGRLVVVKVGMKEGSFSTL